MVRTSVAVHARQTREALVCSFQPRHIVEGSVGARVLAVETRALRTVVTWFTEKSLIVVFHHGLGTHTSCVAVYTGSVSSGACVAIVSACRTRSGSVHRSRGAVVAHRTCETFS